MSVFVKTCTAFVLHSFRLLRVDAMPSATSLFDSPCVRQPSSSGGFFAAGEERLSHKSHFGWTNPACQTMCRCRPYGDQHKHWVKRQTQRRTPCAATKNPLSIRKNRTYETTSGRLPRTKAPLSASNRSTTASHCALDLWLRPTVLEKGPTPNEVPAQSRIGL
jgi:hypothetical protein